MGSRRRIPALVLVQPAPGGNRHPTHIEAGRAATVLAAELGEEIKQLRRRVRALQEKVEPGQGHLFGT
jgi:LmbE family N-acetylglucosaminyl deacetylase